MKREVAEGLKIRCAQEGDCDLILRFIRSLAEYEKMADQVVATADGLRDTLFTKKQAEVIIGEYRGEPVAFALFFHNYSTFLGKAGLYLEDLFVEPSHRGLGIGKAMFVELAKIALKRGCERLDWWCLDWNENSIRFYEQMGAEAMDEWTVYRLNRDALAEVGADGLSLPTKSIRCHRKSFAWAKPFR